MSDSVIPSTNAANAVMDTTSNSVLNNAASTSGGAIDNNITGNHVASSFGAGTSLGVPSSSFLCNVAGVDSSSASSFDEFRQRNPVNQGSSDSGNIFRASQPTSSVLGIPERDRQLIRSRYAPKSASTTATQRGAHWHRGAGAGGGRTAAAATAPRESRRVLARLNETGSKVQETRLPSFILVNTPYSKTSAGEKIKIRDPITGREAIKGRGGVPSRSGVTGRDAVTGRGIGVRPHKSRNQNNASDSNAVYDQGEPMDAEETTPMRVAAKTTTTPIETTTPMQTRRPIMQTTTPSRGTPPYQTAAAAKRAWTTSAATARQSQPFNQGQGQGQGQGQTNFNAAQGGDDANVCGCNGDEQGKLNADINTDIVPKRRQRRKGKNQANNYDEEECGESMWDWYRDATWGCKKYPEVYYCDEDCPSILEYLLCPEDEACYDEEELVEWTQHEAEEEEPDLEAVITYRQGETEKHEVRNMNIVKKGEDDFTVSWKHPPGEHPVYVVVVYPPADGPGSKPRGPNCGPCADEDECICGMHPVFRMHLDGSKTQCDFPIECLQPGKNFTVEVATLNASRDESYGNSLVLIDVYEAKN